MDFFESLGPIILLIIWSIIATQARKRKNREEQEQDQPQPQQQQRRRPRDDHRGGSLLDTIRKKMETLARELEGGTSEKQPQEKKADIRRPLATHDLSAEKPKIEHKIEPEIFELPKRGATILPAAQKPRQQTAVTRGKARYITADDFEKDKLRKAVIWSEILQPPVSLRRPSSM